jgi:hypothetical protein
MAHEAWEFETGYRKAWEFETGYSKLVATMVRVEELQRPRAHGAASQPPGRSEVSLDTPFPSHECREFLAEIYHEAWGAMRSALEDDACIVSALKENTEKVEGDGGGKEMEGSHPRETETGRSCPGQGARGTGKARCLRHESASDQQCVQASRRSSNYSSVFFS